MKYLVLALALFSTACAQLWMDPIKPTGSGTYVITHTMYQFSPVTGVRQGVINRAIAKCKANHQDYSKISEEMTPGGTLSYTLTFQCHEPEFGI